MVGYNWMREEWGGVARNQWEDWFRHWTVKVSGLSTCTLRTKGERERKSGHQMVEGMTSIASGWKGVQSHEIKGRGARTPESSGQVGNSKNQGILHFRVFSCNG